MNQSKSYAMEKCAWCETSGKWRLAPGHHISCIVCGGKGQVAVAQPAGKCRHCDGSGRRPAASPCLKCAGTGSEKVAGQD